MKSDFELIQEYKDISKTNKPKIAPYCGDMFIDVEMEYLMRKDLQQRIDKAIKILQDSSSYDDSDFEGMKFQNDLLEILRGNDE